MSDQSPSSHCGSSSHDCHSSSSASLSFHNFKKTFRTVLLGIIFVAVCQLIPILEQVGIAFVSYLHTMAWAILLGLFIGGLMDYLIPKEYISHYLSARNHKTILYSVGFGFLMSVCSHGILAIAMELHKKGASTSAVIAFLLASPWANLPLTLILISFFGIKALLYVLGALFIAVIAGLVFQILEAKGWVESQKTMRNRNDDFSMLKDIRRRCQKYQFGFKRILLDIQGVVKGILSVSDMVLGWILFGALLASFINIFVPEDIFHRFMGPSVGGLFATLGVATILEVCSEGTAPLAYELYRQTGAFGNAFVFLMAGVVTDYTEIGLVWKNIGHKTALWLPILTVPLALILGYLFNLI